VQDYGSILLFDERYTYSSNRSQISKWLRDKIVAHNEFDLMLASLRTFFDKMNEKGFIPKVD